MFVEHEKREANPHIREMDILSRQLLAVAAYIEDHGWCQNRLKDDAGRVCLGGAIWAVHGHGVSPNEIDILRQATFGYVNSFLDDSLSTWNDDPDRTQAEVVAKLRAVALGG